MIRYIQSLAGTKLPQQDIVRFSIDVNVTEVLNQTATSVDAAQDSERFMTDWGVLMLPTSYVAEGVPTRLVIGMHGGGGSVTSGTSQTETYPIYQYLVSQGYAVMDMSGLPVPFAEELNIDRYRVMGDFLAVTCYQKGYNWVIENYNILTTGVFINGGSNGGLTSFSVLKNSSIPVIAMSGMSPLIDLKNNAWNLTSGAYSGGWATSYQNRLSIIMLHNMTDPTVYELDGVTVDVDASMVNLLAATYEDDKVRGFDPFIDAVNTLKTPYKLWQPVDDPVISVPAASTFITNLKDAGTMAILRSMDSGGHAPESAGSVIGTFVYKGITKDLYPAPAELLMWFNRFN